jgi:hypothetical protein
LSRGNTHSKSWGRWYAFKENREDGKINYIIMYQRRVQTNPHQWIFTGTNKNATEKFFLTLLVWGPLKLQYPPYTMEQLYDIPETERDAIVNQYKVNFIDRKWSCIRCDRPISQSYLKRYLMQYEEYPLFCFRHRN